MFKSLSPYPNNSVAQPSREVPPKRSLCASITEDPLYQGSIADRIAKLGVQQYPAAISLMISSDSKEKHVLSELKEGNGHVQVCSIA
jgi:hypothetical protein